MDDSSMQCMYLQAQYIHQVRQKTPAKPNKWGSQDLCWLNAGKVKQVAGPDLNAAFDQLWAQSLMANWFITD